MLLYIFTVGLTSVHMRPAQFKYKKPQFSLQLATRGDSTMICAAALVVFLITHEAAGRITAAKPEVTHGSTAIQTAGQLQTIIVMVFYSVVDCYFY